MTRHDLGPLESPGELRVALGISGLADAQRGLLAALEAGGLAEAGRPSQRSAELDLWALRPPTVESVEAIELGLAGLARRFAAFGCSLSAPRRSEDAVVSGLEHEGALEVLRGAAGEILEGYGFEVEPRDSVVELLRLPAERAPEAEVGWDEALAALAWSAEVRIDHVALLAPSGPTKRRRAGWRPVGRYELAPTPAQIDRGPSEATVRAQIRAELDARIARRLRLGSGEQVNR